MPRRKNFYVVAHGRQRGIYSTWEQCSAQVHQYPGARFKGCQTLEEARDYLNNNPAPSCTSASVRLPQPVVQREDSPPSELRAPPPAPQRRARSPEVYEDVDDEGSDDDYEVVYVPRRRVEAASLPVAASRAVARTATKQHDVYVDGACSKNGHSSDSRAGYGGYYGEGDDRNYSHPLSPTEAHTNNRAELHAVIHALKQGFRDGGVSPHDGHISPGGGNLSRLRVHSDSKYVVEGLTKYSKKWIRNGFTLSDGTSPVQNQDLWKELISLRDAYNTGYAAQTTGESRHYTSANTLNDESEGFEILHVKGHANVHGNEMADRLAVQGAQKSHRDDTPSGQ